MNRFSKHFLGAVILALSALAFWAFSARTIYSELKDPTGNFTALITYRSYLSFIPMSPGSSGDKPGFIRIIGNEGMDYGEIPLPMIQMGRDLIWTKDGAEVRCVGEWNFTSNECFYWSEKQDKRIYVNRSNPSRT